MEREERGETSSRKISRGAWKKTSAPTLLEEEFTNLTLMEVKDLYKLLLDICNKVIHFIKVSFHSLAVLMFEIKLKLFSPCLLNYCRMPTHHQNCLGGTPCSHSPQSRDFSNGSKGSLSAAQQYTKFYFPI